MEVLRTDVAIIGGGLGACAAALAAARLGRRVILTEETHWIGGQLTNQAVPPDEHPWIESFGATASYRASREGIRAYYRTHTPLTPEARRDAHLNPGRGWVSRLCHDPRIAVAVLHQMMIPHQLNGRLFVMHPHRPILASTDGDRIHLTADPAFLLEPEELPVTALQAEGVDFNRRLVGFSVREPGPAAPDIRPDEYYALLANAADYIVERYGAEVVFVPMEKTDVQHSHAVVAHMNNAERAEILRRKYSPRQILDLMGRFEFAVGMRLHFLIFAALRGTPFAALPYASKVSGLLEDLEMGTPPLGSIGIGQLIARIDRSWDARAEIRATVGRRLPALRARAAQTNELLLALLGGAIRKARPEAMTERTGYTSHPIEPH